MPMILGTCAPSLDQISCTMAAASTGRGSPASAGNGGEGGGTVAAAPVPVPAPAVAMGGDGGPGGAGPVEGGVAEPLEVTHRVSAGESLWSISRRYGVSMDDLRGWNGLGARPVLRIGQSLVIRTGGTGATVSTAPRMHVVRRGDTLGAIARRYGVDTGGLARENGLSLRSTIRPGDRLRIPEAR